MFSSIREASEPSTVALVEVIAVSTIGFKHAREVALILQPQERAALLHDLRVSLDEPCSEAAVVEAVADRWADLYANVCMCEIAALGVADTPVSSCAVFFRSDER